VKSEQNTGTSEVQNIQIKNDEEFKTAPGPFDNNQKEAPKKEEEKKDKTKKIEKK